MAFGEVLFVTEDFHVSPDEAVNDAPSAVDRPLLHAFVDTEMFIYYVCTSCLTAVL